MQYKHNAENRKQMTTVPTRLQRRLAAKVVRLARRMARAAAALDRLDTLLRAKEGHSARQFGWRSDNEGFDGIALYAEAVAAAAEML